VTTPHSASGQSHGLQQQSECKPQNSLYKAATKLQQNAIRENNFPLNDLTTLLSHAITNEQFCLEQQNLSSK